MFIMNIFKNKIYYYVTFVNNIFCLEYIYIYNILVLYIYTYIMNNIYYYYVTVGLPNSFGSASL